MRTPDSPQLLDSIAELEALERSRRQMLIAVLITSSIWILAQIVHGFEAARLPETLRGVVILIGVIGSLVWMFCMWRFHRFQMRVLGDPALRNRLDDERVLSLRREAIYRSWWVLVIAVGLGVGVSTFVDLPGQTVFLGLLLLAINPPIAFYLYLDRG